MLITKQANELIKDTLFTEDFSSCDLWSVVPSTGPSLRQTDRQIRCMRQHRHLDKFSACRKQVAAFCLSYLLHPYWVLPRHIPRFNTC